MENPIHDVLIATLKTDLDFAAVSFLQEFKLSPVSQIRPKIKAEWKVNGFAVLLRKLPRPFQTHEGRSSSN